MVHSHKEGQRWNKERPRVSDLWRLRNDVRNVVAYKCSTVEFIFTVLTPIEASIIPLFDGNNTFDDIKAVFFDIFDVSPDIQEEFSDNLDQTLERLMSLQGFLSFEGDISPSLKNPEKLIPDLAYYHFSVTRLERPLSVQIAFTNQCVCNCRYCCGERRSCPEADINQWRTVFDELSSNEIFIVDIAGGDILTRKDAFSILKEMVDRDFVFFLSTKCFISKEDAERLAELGIGRLDVPKYVTRHIQISVDSADDDTASFLVRHPHYFQQTTETVKNLIQAGISPRIKCVLTAYNADAPEGIVNHFADLGVANFDFVYYTKSYYHHDDALFLTWEQKLRLHDIAERLKSDSSLNIMFQDVIGAGTSSMTAREQWDSRNICTGGRTNMIVQPNGDATLCDRVPHADPFIVGNVFNEGILQVWKSQKLLNFMYPQKEKFSGTVCFDCPEFDECIGQKGEKGYCFRDTLFYFGSPYDAPPECPRQNKIPPRII
ncbi:MAG: radical SAM protein [Theionarchaea archaeon]|nr:radical SAM protein [Theionarchaea archaeon]